MGVIEGEITFLAFRKSLPTEAERAAVNGGDYTGWTVLFDNTALYAVKKTWEEIPDALVAAYLYSFVFTS